MRGLVHLPVSGENAFAHDADLFLSRQALSSRALKKKAPVSFKWVSNVY
jgi:hypothetical protein